MDVCDAWSERRQTYGYLPSLSWYSSAYPRRDGQAELTWVAGYIPRLWSQTFNCSLLLICRPRKDERLSWHGWLTYSGRFTHISNDPSVAGRAQNRESSTTVPRSQPTKRDNLITLLCYGRRLTDPTDWR